MTDPDPIEATGQSLAEEIANTVTHGIGAALSIAGLVVMVLLFQRRIVTGLSAGAIKG